MKQDILAMAYEYKPWSPCNLSYLSVLPPVVKACTAIYCSFTCDYNILHIDSCYDSREAVKRISLPGAKVILILLIVALYHSRKYSESLSLGKCRKHRILCKVKYKIAL